MKNLTNSEFAQMLAEMFPALDIWERGKIYVFGEDGNFAISAQETTKGWSSVKIGTKTYNKMTASEKAQAVEYVKNLHIEIVTEKLDMCDGTFRAYWIAGAWGKHMEDQKHCHWYESRKANLVSIESYR